MLRSAVHSLACVGAVGNCSEVLWELSAPLSLRGGRHAVETAIKSDPPVELTIESTIEFILSSTVESTVESTV